MIRSAYQSNGGNYGVYGRTDSNSRSNSGFGQQNNVSDAQTRGGHQGWRSDLFAGPESIPNENSTFNKYRNGRLNSGGDNVQMFDCNREGRFDQSDVDSTNTMMKTVVDQVDKAPSVPATFCRGTALVN